MSERIHKALARAGVGSRRQIEDWIRKGQVKVNGKVAEIGQPIEMTDKIIVGARRVNLEQAADVPTRVLVYRKIAGQVVTRKDPEGRETVFDKLPRPGKGRWIAVGRLDVATSGVLLFTTNGELAARLMHPSHQLRREYACRILGEPPQNVLDSMQAGVELDDGEAKFETLVCTTRKGDDSINRWYKVTVAEGRNRLVRRLWESQGYQVSRLIRTCFGPIEFDKRQRAGTAREATAQEIKALGELVGLDNLIDDTPDARKAIAAKAEGKRHQPRNESPDRKPQRPSKYGPQSGPKAGPKSGPSNPWGGSRNSGR